MQLLVNANDDNLPDILLVGNYYDNNIQMGRNDADFGTILLIKGMENLPAKALMALKLRGRFAISKK